MIINNGKTLRLALTGLMAALSYVAFTFIKIPIPMPGGDAVAIHLGNAVCVIASLLLGGFYGGLSGAIGMTIADLMDPIYITSAPKTFILKFAIGLITGLVAHKIANISKEHTRTYVMKWTIIASAIALGFNVIADPIFGYFYKNYVLGVPQELAVVTAKIAAGATLINSIMGTIVSVIVYVALRPILSREGLLVRLAGILDRDMS